MIALDLQLARAEILIETPRPAPEPTEGELRAVLEHLASPQAPQHPADKGAAAE